MTPSEELFTIAGRLRAAAATGKAAEVTDALDAISEAASAVGKSFSGSWMGYHARVYYDGLKPPPAGAQFSVEDGLLDRYHTDTVGA